MGSDARQGWRAELAQRHPSEPGGTAHRGPRGVDIPRADAEAHEDTRQGGPLQGIVGSAHRRVLVTCGETM